MRGVTGEEVDCPNNYVCKAKGHMKQLQWGPKIVEDRTAL